MGQQPITQTLYVSLTLDSTGQTFGIVTFLSNFVYAYPRFCQLYLIKLGVGIPTFGTKKFLELRIRFEQSLDLRQ